MSDTFAVIRDLSVTGPVPPLAPVRQRVRGAALADPSAAAQDALRAAPVDGLVDARVAVAVGSRGIASLPLVVAEVIAWLRTNGAEPYVVPAMGSHAGATAKGQQEMLAGLGISEETVGAPIRATMETVPLGRLADGPECHLDANAAAADHLFLVNRVKPHTAFRGPVESGLAKMAAIGLGNQVGAQSLHAGGATRLPHSIPAVYQLLAAKKSMLGGLGLCENARHALSSITFVPADGIGADAEARLLDAARELLPRLPFEEIDVLVVEEFGKDKSGAGIDPNVVGRMDLLGQPERPSVGMITAHRISDASHGNAVGMGIADLVPLAVAERVDLHQTYVNGLTAGGKGLRRVRIPMVLPTDRDVITAAVRSCGVPDPDAVRLVRIRDTVDLERLHVSPVLLPEVAEHPDLKQLDEAAPIPFDPDGALSLD